MADGSGFSPPPPPGPPRPGMGHNEGPRLEDPQPGVSWRRYCWTKAHRAAWKTPPREIALRRLKRAEELGISYHEYTAEILDTGRFR